MRDYRNAKVMAQTLRDDLSEKSFKLSHSESLELVAHMLGLRDWNVLAAKIETGSQPAEARPVEDNAKAPLSCSFCGKTQHEVAKLIAGPAAYICDRCVGLCDDILLDEDPGYAEITRDALASKSIEELILLKARIGRSLSTAQRNREAIAPYIRNATSATDAKLSPQAALFLGKSPEERQAHVSALEARIGAMQRGIAIAGEFLAKKAMTRDSNDP